MSEGIVMEDLWASPSPLSDDPESMPDGEGAIIF